MRRLCVFCGSSPGTDASFVEAARALGACLGQRGAGLVYGGASVGLMGVVADAAMGAGAHVTGVIPAAMVGRELAHRRLPDLRVVASMHARKALMADLADGFVALPGGMGTLDETFEILTWAQLGIHDKPVGLLDVDGYFAPLLAFLDHAVAKGFVRPEHRALVLVEASPERLVDALLERAARARGTSALDAAAR
jgi:hypothetical protein